MVDLQQQGERAMLSRAEQQYIKSPTTFNSDYQRILRHRIKVKVQRLKALMPLLEAHGFSVTADCNGVTKFCNGERGLNQASFKECLVARERFELSSAGPKPAMLDWVKDKAEFIQYLRSKRYNPLYFKAILSNLSKHVTELSEPMDIIAISSTLSSGQQHNLNRALSALFSFYELKGYPTEQLNRLRKAMPKDDIGVDIKIPSEQQILSSISRLNLIPLRYKALYNLLLDSGLRLTEAVKALNNQSEPTKVNGFYRVTLGYFRASKLAYAAYFTEATYSLIGSNKEPIKECGARRYLSKYKFVTPKYLRKFAFDKMIELNIPESVADFIQGRTPKSIGAKHYMAIVRQADNFYGKYASYLSGLRSQLNNPAQST